VCCIVGVRAGVSVGGRGGKSAPEDVLAFCNEWMGGGTDGLSRRRWLGDGDREILAY